MALFGLFGAKKERQQPQHQLGRLVRFLGAIGVEREDESAEPAMEKHAQLIEAGLEPAKILVTEALERFAGTLRIEPKGQAFTSALVIDGVAYAGQPLQRGEAIAAVQVLKLLAGLDVAERRRVQKGMLGAELGRRKFELEVVVQPTPQGERLLLNVVDKGVPLEKLNELGMGEPMRERIRGMLAGSPGLFLCAGPPGSGLTTLFYATLGEIDVYLNNVHMLEREPGRQLINVTHRKLDAGQTMAEGLLAVARQQPEVIVVADIPDAESAKAVFKYAEEYAMVAPLSATDVFNGLAKSAQLVGNAVTTGQRLKAIVVQKLARKLCEKCKESYRPKPEFLKKAGLPDDVKILYRKSNPVPPPGRPPEETPICPRCNGLGYRGRTGIFELLEITPAIRQILAKKPDMNLIKAQARKEGLWPMQVDGLRVVAEGKTSLDELARVMK